MEDKEKQLNKSSTIQTNLKNFTCTLALSILLVGSLPTKAFCDFVVFFFREENFLALPQDVERFSIRRFHHT